MWLVRVAWIEPGFFTTEITANSMKRRESHEGDPYGSDYSWITTYYEQSLGGEGGDPVEVADAIVHAACDPATHTLAQPGRRGRRGGRRCGASDRLVRSLAP